MASNTPQDVLQQEILTDGKRRAERILEAANQEAEKTVATRRAALADEVGKILEEGRQRGEKRADMVLRTVGQEVERRKLMAREALIQEVLDEAARQVGSLSGQAYEDLLVGLAAEAIRNMCAESFTVQFLSRREEKLNVASLGGKVQSILAGEGRKVAVRAEDERGSAGGVIVLSVDGRLRWDNTIHARLRRLRGAIRQRIAPILFEES